MKVIVTGGAGFIGSEVVRQLILDQGFEVLNIDLLTYAGHRENLEMVDQNGHYRFSQTDICDAGNLETLFQSFRPDAVVHLAAESHVDRSIDGPAPFIQTNIVGTYQLLQQALQYWRSLDTTRQSLFRFLTVSTDEVFGTLGSEGFFCEKTPYAPRSPYSASKAAADHLTRAWHDTFGLPTIVTNCSNNYGPYQFPEKLIPVTIQKLLNQQAVPVYGDGSNVRDWLYVGDHAAGIVAALKNGKPGQTYLMGGDSEKSNLEVVTSICRAMDDMKPRSEGRSYRELITFVTDRPGHDFRYAVDASKIKAELQWSPSIDFDAGIRKTIQWYFDHQDWVDAVSPKEQGDGRRGLGQSETPVAPRSQQNLTSHSPSR